ncbi:hypothetical protein GALMADRAFT_118246 [Galerina marginata CBS 339.88]|uniref:UDENN domain-containing protein n=1 Tax=Galerina marginata (strain CBS 339.88) TaxID=685588 RepID=A0A067TFV1_GALM3|nr:hypothetical protein GALMADRAFT_118246 [Galerina marginata CBS 339.88]
MPPRVPSELKLDPPLDEEDISDLSPYLSLPSSTSSRASSSTIGSSLTSSRNDDFEFDSDIPLSSEITPGNPETPKKLSFSLQLPSPSSPTLSKFLPESHQISRSQTLPRGFQREKEHAEPRRIHSEINSLAVDQVSVQRMRRWILGIAVVEFDLDSGPVVDGLFPPLMLLPAESENIAFCAFPDSALFDQGSQTHSFRIREQTVTLSPDKRPPTKDGFIYGFSHFIQRRDSSSKRGYQQRSLVILTQHQYPALFSSLAGIFGPLFEQHGTPMLEAACHNIATWSNPTAGQTLELGFLGSVLQVEIPHSVDVQQVTETSSFNEKYDPKAHILAMTAPFLPPPILLFEAALANLWSIWECLVLCEPILIFGTSPAQTSQAIWWLRDLLRPIPLAGDIRPYFTMQDSDHSRLVNRLPPKAGLLLGVTNPFFEKSCVHWPHVLSLGRRVPVNSPRQKSPILGAPAGPPPGWKTKTHRRYISKDRVLLKQLENALKGDEKMRMDASLALRRHFCSRSTQLITPLARYLNTLIPSPSEVHHARKASAAFSSSTSLSSASSSRFSTPMPLASPHGQHSRPLRLKPFNSDNFFASLKIHGSILPFKSTSKRTEFYQRWLKSPAFGTWLAQQEQIVQSVLNDPPPPPPALAAPSTITATASSRGPNPS